VAAAPPGQLTGVQSLILPHSNVTVSRFCLGAGAFGTSITGDKADRLLAAYVEAGGTFFDTAHCYAFWVPNGLGASERDLAASLKRIGAWDAAVIGTKGGHPDCGPDYRRPADFLSESVLHSDIEDSLDRLQTSRLDLFYLHRDDGIVETRRGSVIGDGGDLATLLGHACFERRAIAGVCDLVERRHFIRQRARPQKRVLARCGHGRRG